MLQCFQSGSYSAPSACEWPVWGRYSLIKNIRIFCGSLLMVYSLRTRGEKMNWCWNFRCCALPVCLSLVMALNVAFLSLTNVDEPHQDPIHHGVNSMVSQISATSCLSILPISPVFGLSMSVMVAIILIPRSQHISKGSCRILLVEMFYISSNEEAVRPRDMHSHSSACGEWFFGPSTSSHWEVPSTGKISRVGEETASIRAATKELIHHTLHDHTAWDMDPLTTLEVRGHRGRTMRKLLLAQHNALIAQLLWWETGTSLVCHGSHWSSGKPP